jgi:hypothetical protein
MSVIEMGNSSLHASKIILYVACTMTLLFGPTVIGLDGTSATATTVQAGLFRYHGPGSTFGPDTLSIRAKASGGNLAGSNVTFASTVTLKYLTSYGISLCMTSYPFGFYLRGTYQNGSYTYKVYETITQTSQSFANSVEVELFRLQVRCGSAYGTFELSRDLATIAYLGEWYFEYNMNDYTNYTTNFYQPTASPVCLAGGGYPMSLKVKAFLEGAYDSTTGVMRNQLASSSLIPVVSPYRSQPWNYPCGGDSVASGFFLAHPEVVDWVLVELADTGASLSYPFGHDTSIYQQVGFITKTGWITDISGSDELNFMFYPYSHAWLTIYHRNHLKATYIWRVIFPCGCDTSPWVYDFTLPNYSYGNTLKYVGNGKYALPSGDASADNAITISDRNSHWRLQNGTNGYLSGDFNLDGAVTISDRNSFWRPNNGRSGPPPLPF